MTQQMPLVSILVPVYNTEAWLDEALRSAVEQTYPNIEVIVVDDGSTDGSLAVARRVEQAYPDRVRVISQKNAGACAARNRALTEAQGEFVKFLDADDVLALDVIRVQVSRALDFHPDENIITYTSHAYCDPMLRPKRVWTRGAWYFSALFSKDPAERVAALLTHNVRTLLPLHHTKCLLEVGGFREDLKRGQEYDLHLRLALMGVRFLHVPYVGGYSRESKSDTRISNRPREGAASFLALFRTRRKELTAVLGDPLPPIVRAALSRQLWNRTRSLYWNGDIDGAKLIAKEAQASDPALRHASSRSFRFFGRLFGPLQGERVLVLARRIIQRT